MIPHMLTLKIDRHFLLGTFLALCIIINGCAGDYGSLRKNAETNHIFKSYQILSDHNYYFAGPEGRPDAIMAIHQDYWLDSSQWTNIYFTEKTLKEWVDRFDFYHQGRTRFYPYGFNILDAKGKKIGVWYSIWDWTAIIVGPGNRVQVFPPTDSEPFGDGGDDFDSDHDD